MDMDTDALGDLAVGDALRMRFPGYGMFTGKVVGFEGNKVDVHWNCLLYTSPSPRDQRGSRMPSSA